jgi:hypothetical protein
VRLWGDGEELVEEGKWSCQDSGDISCSTIASLFSMSNIDILRSIINENNHPLYYTSTTVSIESNPSRTAQITD